MYLRVAQQKVKSGIIKGKSKSLFSLNFPIPIFDLNIQLKSSYHKFRELFHYYF